MEYKEMDLTQLEANGSLKDGISTTEIKTKEQAEQWVADNKPVELVRGGVYCGIHKGVSVLFRVEAMQDSNVTEVYSVECSADSSFCLNSYVYLNSFRNSTKKATPEQERQLFLAELKAGWFWNQATEQLVRLEKGLLVYINNVMQSLSYLENDVLYVDDITHIEVGIKIENINKINLA